MFWRKGKSEQALVVFPQQEVIPPAPQGPVLDINANSHVMQGIGQQIASIGPNSSFTIEHENSGKGSRLTFSRSIVPQLVRPLPPVAPERMEGDLSWDGLRKIEKQIKKIRQDFERSKSDHKVGRMDLNGIPCMLQKTADGYDLMRIGPRGELEFITHLGGKV